MALLASAAVVSGAEELSPFLRFLRPVDAFPNLHNTTLDLRITAVTNVVAPVSMRFKNGPAEVFGLPIRIENRSGKTITAIIAHEWYGGLWPPTDLRAAAKRAEAPPEYWQASEVFLVGELDTITQPTVWQPGQSHEFLVHMN